MFVRINKLEEIKMLAANIEIKRIDYETTFDYFFPVVSEKLMTIDFKICLYVLFKSWGIRHYRYSSI